MKLNVAAAALLPVVLAACSPGESANEVSNTPTDTGSAAVSREPVRRWYAFEQVALGGRVYQANCAACHGVQGEGAPDWKKVGPDGKYPAPPLNGTGHAWHHPLKILFHVVKNGSPGGQGNMPPWGGKISDDEIVSVIAWFQSKWPEQIYAAWIDREVASRGGGNGKSG